MPSPIGHTLAGCGVALALIPPEMPQAWEAWTLCLIGANLPDLDFIPGLLAGNSRVYHRGPSHSVMAALVAAGLGASLIAWPAMPWLTRAGLIFFAYGSHVGLDCCTPGRGILLGWPISQRRYQVAHPWFRSVTIGKPRQGPWRRRGTQRLLWAIAREVLLVGPGVAVMAFARGLLWLAR